MTFLLPSADRTEQVAGELRDLGFLAAASPEPMAGFGYILQVTDVAVPEVRDLMVLIDRHAPEAQQIGR